MVTAAAPSSGTPLTTCGPLPDASVGVSRQVQVSLHGPVEGASGTRYSAAVSLKSITDQPLSVAFGDPELYILSGGHVVGRYVGGSRRTLRMLTVPGGDSVPLEASVLLSGCPDGPTDRSRPDATRRPLPVGAYQLVAVVAVSTSGEPPQRGRDHVVSQPLAIQVTAAG